jgi:hypothetical protein
MGKIFGSRQNAPGYIAGLCIIFSMIALALLIVFGSENARTSQGMTIFGGVVTLALGYLFGRSGGSAA